MSRIQISSEVSRETRRQFDEIVINYGYTNREVLTIAIRDMYQEMMEAKMFTSDDWKEMKESNERAISYGSAYEPTARELIAFRKFMKLIEAGGPKPVSVPQSYWDNEIEQYEAVKNAI